MAPRGGWTEVVYKKYRTKKIIDGLGLAAVFSTVTLQLSKYTK